MRPLILCLGLLLLPSLAAAQSHRAVILTQLDTVTSLKRSEGYTVHAAALPSGSLVGLLRDEGAVFVEIMLQAGREYFIPGGCDNDCDDLDLRVMAPNSETVLAEDIEDDDVPILSFRARETGPHLLMVSMASCSEDLCYFGFRVLTK